MRNEKIQKVTGSLLDGLQNSLSRLISEKDQLNVAHPLVDTENLDQAINMLEKSILTVSEINIFSAEEVLNDFIAQAGNKIKTQITFQLIGNDHNIDFKQYWEQVELLKEVTNYIITNYGENRQAIHFTLNISFKLDLLCMDIFANVECTNLAQELVSQISNIPRGINCEFIRHETNQFNLMISVKRATHFENVLLVDAADQNFAILQHNVLAVIRAELNNGNHILYKGENISLIDLKYGLKLSSTPNYDKRINFAHIFSDEQIRPKMQTIVLCQVDNYKYGLIVDRVIESVDAAIYYNHTLVRSFGFYGGFIKNKTTSLALVIDPVLLIKYVIDNNISQTSYNNNPEVISEMITYLIDFEKKIDQIGDSVKFENNNILLLEDSPLFRKLISKRLEEESYNTFCFDDSALALEYLRQNTHINVVIADFNVSDMDGILFAQKCRAIRSDIAIISMVTAVEAGEIRQRGFGGLFSVFVAKTDQEKIVKIANSLLIQELEYNDRL